MRKVSVLLFAIASLLASSVAANAAPFSGSTTGGNGTGTNSNSTAAAWSYFGSISGDVTPLNPTQKRYTLSNTAAYSRVTAGAGYVDALFDLTKWINEVDSNGDAVDTLWVQPFTNLRISNALTHILEAWDNPGGPYTITPLSHKIKYGVQTSGGGTEQYTAAF
jgi:hypothetical protein